jgi:hypothetical protein
MHLLRQTQPGPGSFRQSLLSMKSGLFLFFFTLSLVSCAKTNDSPNNSIFILRDGYFQETEDLKGYAELSPLPWPLQIRIADIYCLDSTLYFFINRKGLASLVLEPDGIAKFSYFYDPVLFDSNTAGLIFPFKDSLICHVYEDDFLSEKKMIPLSSNTFSFIKFTKTETGPVYEKTITPALQQQNPAWQAVVVNKLSNETVAIEWKYSAEDEVKFFYSSFNFTSEKEERQNRQWFLASYKIADIRGNNIAAPYALLFDSVLAALKADNKDHLVTFTLTDLSNKQVERYFYQTEFYNKKDNGYSISIPVTKQEKILSALLPKGKVLLIHEESMQLESLSLPSLPPHFRYTNVIFLDSFICASWEDVRFTHVGAAGLLVMVVPF